MIKKRDIEDDIKEDDIKESISLHLLKTKLKKKLYMNY